MQGPSAHDADPPEREVVTGQYVSPKSSNGRWQAAGTAAAGLAMVFAKFKGLLLILLNAKWVFLGFKLLLSSFSLLASIWFYALFWGWPFAAVFVILILLHELGHTAAMRYFGVPSSLPYFIPGFGAFVTMGTRPASALAEAYIALAGPFAGGLASLACYHLGRATGNDFWIAVAYTGFFLNLFNLIPFVWLDGGRVAAVISPRLWIAGLAALILGAIFGHWWNPLLFIFAVLSLPQVVRAWRGEIDPRYAMLTFEQRAGVTLCYLAVAWFLFDFMMRAHVQTPAMLSGTA